MRPRHPRIWMAAAPRLAGALLVAALASGCGAVGVSAPPATPSGDRTPPAPAGPAALGTITVTETGCTLDGAPERIEPGPFVLDVHNGTPAAAGFDMFRIGQAASVEDFVTHVEAERSSALAGEPFLGPPIWATHIVGSDLLDSGTSATLEGTAAPGPYAVVCLWKFEDVTSDPVRPFALVGPISIGVAPSNVTEIDVAQIVLGAADAPVGARVGGTHGAGQSTVSGRDTLTLPVWFLSAEEQQRFRNLPGYIAGTSSGFGDPVSQALYVSVGILFEDAASASQALAAYEHVFRTGWGLDDPEPTDPGLGDRSLLFTGPAAVQGGEPGFYYLWRVDRLLLEAVAVGDVQGEQLAGMEAAVHDMALEMERRAGAIRPAAPAPLTVVQQWIEAVNAGDNVGATSLFAPRAVAVIGDQETQDILAFNESLECSATVVSSSESGEAISVEVELGERQGKSCPNPGDVITITASVRNGKIVAIEAE